MSDTRYCYPNSDVLINKLNIREQDKLYAFERRLTMLRLLELMDNPICGQFDNISCRILATSVVS